MKRRYQWALAATLICGSPALTSCQGLIDAIFGEDAKPASPDTTKPEQPKTVDVTGITLDRDSAFLEVDQTGTLTATVEPDDATDKTVTWSSEDEAIAKVSKDGKVTVVGTGKTKITAKVMSSTTVAPRTSCSHPIFRMTV